MTQLTQGRIGHLEFGAPDIDILVTAQKAIQQLITKHAGVTPEIMVVNGEHESRRAEFEALGIVQITFGSTQPHHCWVGAEKVKSPARSAGRASVRVIENVRARVLAAADLPSVPVVETVIALPLPVVIETPISTALCRVMVGVPALPAPKTAGLLCAVNPRGPEVDEQDDLDESAAESFAAMVLDLSASRAINPEYVDAFRVAHSSSEKARPALLALINGGSPSQWIERPITDDERIWKPLAMRQMQRSPRAWRIHRMLDRQIEDALPVQEEIICLPAPHVALPQEVTMHPRDVMRELAAQKATPAALSAPGRIPPHNSFSYEAHKQRKAEAQAARETQLRSSEELLEEAVTARLVVTPQALDLFIEDLRFAVEHLEIEDAGLLVDGHRLLILDKKHKINVFQPLLGKPVLIVATRTDEGDVWHFDIRRHDVRRYLEDCQQAFAQKKIKPLRAGEKYDFEMKDQDGEKAA